MIPFRRLALLTCTLHVVSLVGMNLIRPYQILLRPPKLENSWMQLYLIEQYGFKTTTFGEHGTVNPLQIYQCQQDLLAMLDGFDPNSTIGQKRIRVDASNNGIRGQALGCADFHVNTAAHFGVRFFMPHHMSLACYLPFYSMKLSNVLWQTCTENISMQDARVCAYLTNCLSENICDLGNLNIYGWNRTGFGDTTLSLEWIRNYPQQKPMLHNVTINGRLGLTLPSGLPTGPNKILAIPFGNDRSFGIIFALGLDLYVGEYVKAGLDVQLMHQFGNTLCRRIKTDSAQTDLFLLAKTEAFKDFGMTQQFSLYWQFYNFCKGLSAEVAYQFYKHGDDTLFLNSNEFSTAIANSALNLQSYTTHDAFFMLNYDFSSHMREDARYTPYIGAFVDIPFNGKRAIVAKAVGITLALNF